MAHAWNGCSQSSRFLPQARRIVGSGDENGLTQTLYRPSTILSYTQTIFFFLVRTYKPCKPREWLLSTVCPPIRTCGIAIDRPQSSIFSLHQVMPWSQLPLFVTWDLLCLLPEMSCLLTGCGCVMESPESPRSDCSVCRQWYSKILGTKAITLSPIMQVMICWLQCMLS